MNPDPDSPAPPLWDPAQHAAAHAKFLAHLANVQRKNAAAAAAAARPAAGDPSALDHSAGTALLHWCDAAQIRDVIDRTPVIVGKRVKMRAEPLDGYGGSATFTVHEDMSLIRTILKRLDKQRRPMTPFTTETTDRMIVSRDSWRAAVSRFTHQNRYYFEDVSKQASDHLVVTKTDYAVTETAVMLNGVTVALPPGAVITVNGAFGRKTTRHKVLASKDPRLRVELLTPDQEGDRSLLAHVRNLVEEVMELSRQQDRRVEPDPPIELADIVEQAEGYLNPGQSGLVKLSADSTEITVDELNPAYVDVEISPPGPAAADATFQAAYALRLTNADAPDDFVISSIVLIDGVGDSVRIQG